MPEHDPDAGALRVVQALKDAGLTVATGESLTAGLAAATLAEVPGCSAVLRGGVIAYDADVKARILGVTEDQLAAGPVSAPVALALAMGAARALRADVGIGTTGVAGPDPHGGEPAGSVWIAVWAKGRSEARHLALTGGREAVRRQTVRACWELVIDLLE